MRPIQDLTITDQEIEKGYFPECRLEETCECPITDYYSFRLTIVLPYWPIRFRNLGFREYVERTIRQETPAHILPKICWIDLQQMNGLEANYLQWLQLVSQDQPDREQLSDQITRLMKQLNTLTTIYPEGVLHDCQDPQTDENFIILDNTQLGTSEEIEDDFT